MFKVYLCFEGVCRFHHQGESLMYTLYDFKLLVLAQISTILKSQSHVPLPEIREFWS